MRVPHLEMKKNQITSIRILKQGISIQIFEPENRIKNIKFAFYRFFFSIHNNSMFFFFQWSFFIPDDDHYDNDDYHHHYHQIHHH